MPLQAMIFDSVYNTFRGIEAYFKIINGTIQKGQKVKFMSTEKEYLALARSIRNNIQTKI